jgi:hypothetical protein
MFSELLSTPVAPTLLNRVVNVSERDAGDIPVTAAQAIYDEFNDLWQSVISQPEKLSQWLLDRGWSRVGLYGAGNFTKQLVAALDGSGVQVSFVLDRFRRDSLQGKRRGIPVLSPTSKRWRGTADAIILTPFYDALPLEAEVKSLDPRVVALSLDEMCREIVSPSGQYDLLEPNLSVGRTIHAGLQTGILDAPINNSGENGSTAKGATAEPLTSSDWGALPTPLDQVP